MNKKIKLLDLTNYLIHFTDGTCMFIDHYISEAQDEIKSLKNKIKVLEEQLKDENNYDEEASKWYKEAFKQQNNWNELKETLINGIKTIYEIGKDTEFNETIKGCLGAILNKVEEIESRK